MWRGQRLKLEVIHQVCNLPSQPPTINVATALCAIGMNDLLTIQDLFFNFQAAVSLRTDSNNIPHYLEILRVRRRERFRKTFVYTSKDLLNQWLLILL